MINLSKFSYDHDDDAGSCQMPMNQCLSPLTHAATVSLPLEHLPKPRLLIHHVCMICFISDADDAADDGDTEDTLASVTSLSLASCILACRVAIYCLQTQSVDGPDVMIR